MNTRGSVLSFVLVSLLVACVGAEVSPINGKKYPSKPENCEVTEFPSTTPSYPWEDIATVRAYCNVRNQCLEKLRAEVCEAGGDTIYSYNDLVTRTNYTVVATVARRTGAKPVAKTSSVPPAGECDPPCSPGYRCQSGQCIALCNPPCGEGMTCAQDRTCQPNTH